MLSDGENNLSDICSLVGYRCFEYISENCHLEFLLCSQRQCNQSRLGDSELY